MLGLLFEEKGDPYIMIVIDGCHDRQGYTDTFSTSRIPQLGGFEPENLVKNTSDTML